MTKKPKRKTMDVTEMARRGGKARASQMTPEERSESARKAVQARWAAKKAAATEKAPRVKNKKG